MRCYFTFFWSIRNFFDFTSSRPRNKLPPSVWLRIPVIAALFRFYEWHLVAEYR